MLLHAKNISQSVPNVVIHTPDTDVFVTAIAASPELPTNLFIRTGNKGKAQIISIEKVKQSLSLQYDVNDMELGAKSILSLHAFTGCDTTSAFCSKGKVKPLNIFLKSSHYINTFANIGVDESLGDNTLNVLQQFVCDLYGHKGDNTNTLRYRLYSSKQGRLEAKNIPPCLDSLKLHAARATYQSFVWRNCLIAKPEIPSPLDHGSEMNENEQISIK